MTQRNFSMGIFAMAVFGLVLSGCVSQTPAQRPSKHNEAVLWAEYPRIPSKDYIVVGVIILKGVDPLTLSADLMEKAVELGGHDIINVRVDSERMLDKKRVVAASAVAIKYTNETLSPEIHSSLYVPHAGSTEESHSP